MSVLTSDAILPDAPLLDAILSFAAVVIVPLGLNSPSARQMAVVLAAAAILTCGLFLSGGGWSATMAVPWLLVAVGLLWRAASAAHFNADRSLKTITKLAAHGFLVVSAAWAIAACGGYPVMGFDPVIVQLTAIHFQYAGFALPVLTLKAVEVAPGRVTNVTLLLILIGVPAVAAGIAARSAGAQVIATLILTAGCVLAALGQIRAAFTIARPISRTLLALSAACLLSGMALAAVYAVGQSIGREWIDIPSMIKTHGVANAFGFAFCGLMGWLTAVADRAIIPRDCHARPFPV
jgi:hypothetical protein